MLEIPGHYYDATKKKYFRIEKSHTAPSQASWSADAVKKRRREDMSREEARRKADLVKRHVRRHWLRRDMLGGGLLRRETEYVDVRTGGELRCAAWAGGVMDKGRVSFVSNGEGGGKRAPNVCCLWVGHGVAYTTLDETTLTGTYLSTDRNDCLTFATDAFTGEPSPHARLPREMVVCPQMSSITYHEPSHKVLLTSREMNVSCGLCLFSPPVEEAQGEGEGQSPGPRWLLGETTNYQQLSIRNRRWKECLAHSCTPAPASSNLLCVVGTNAGMVSVRNDGHMDWIAPEQANSSNSNSNSNRSARFPREIFTQDFQQSNPNVLLAGGRQPRLWITDLRVPVSEWTQSPHASSITHLRSINPHQVLVAGLQNKMSLYDMRFFGERANSSSSGGGNGNGRAPLLSFPGYTNAAHVHTGWDVCTELGLVAAAHDDGTVKLFSLKTGRTVRSPAVDDVRTDGPVKALMFSTMGGERMPTLWVGEGQALRKFSLGVRHFDDEA
ncbi:hypothetical protein E4U55_004889 [Claviceps digitariae]|nr:hypothetical protein E4U55_004889 [Claviceps digitariae]